MRSHQPMTILKHLIVVCVTFSAMLLAAPALFAQNASSNDRARAFQLLHEGKFSDAQELLEKLAVATPSDADVQFGLVLPFWRLPKISNGDRKLRMHEAGS